MSGRPYAHIRGSEPSVTTIIESMLAKPGLTWAAARETAEFAVHHRDEWDGLETDAAVDRLRRHFRGVWDSRAAMGTAAHAVNEAWCRGEEVDLLALVGDMAETNRQARSWAGREEDVVRSLDLYVAGLEAFWSEWSPTTVRSEYVVRQPGIYIGTADWLVDMRGRRVLLDIKTTAKPDGGIYADSWSLQLSAYRFARERVEFGWEDGHPVELGAHPNEIPDAAAVIHLRGDGRYALYEMQATLEMHETFLGLAAARARLAALPVPTPTNRETAA